MRLVAAAQASASRAQALADRAAALLFYVAVIAGAVTLAWWWVAGDPEEALVRTATVLVIACPHALGLAIPLVIAISTSLGARHGLLVKDRLALERARELDVVIFDKTGTLTRGEPVVVAVSAAPGTTEDEVLGTGCRGGGRLRASAGAGRGTGRRAAWGEPAARDGVRGPRRPRSTGNGRWPDGGRRGTPPGHGDGDRDAPGDGGAG